MTKREYDEVVKIHGEHFKYGDVPTYIRERDDEDSLAEQEEERRMEMEDKIKLSSI